MDSGYGIVFSAKTLVTNFNGGVTNMRIAVFSQLCQAMLHLFLHLVELFFSLVSQFSLFIIFQCYDHVESSVRKASVFCLVAIHSAVGEETLMPHLAELSGTKMKLLNLYIKRSQAGNGGARP